MKPIKNTKIAVPSTTREPSRKVGAIVTLITAVFGLLVASGIAIDPSLQDAVINLVLALAVVIPLIQAEITRAKVFSLESARELVRRAYEAGKNGEPLPEVNLGTAIDAAFEDDDKATN